MSIDSTKESQFEHVGQKSFLFERVYSPTPAFLNHSQLVSQYAGLCNQIWKKYTGVCCDPGRAESGYVVFQVHDVAVRKFLSQVLSEPKPPKSKTWKCAQRNAADSSKNMKYREDCEGPSPEPAPGCPFFSFLLYWCKLYMLKVCAVAKMWNTGKTVKGRVQNPHPAVLFFLFYSTGASSTCSKSVQFTWAVPPANMEHGVEGTRNQTQPCQKLDGPEPPRNRAVPHRKVAI